MNLPDIQAGYLLGCELRRLDFGELETLLLVLLFFLLLQFLFLLGDLPFPCCKFVSDGLRPLLLEVGFEVGASVGVTSLWA